MKGSDMLKGELLLVYGTLRSGERMDLQKQSHNFDVSFVSKDRINGKMYSLGGFPGVKDVRIGRALPFDPKLPTVTGEVFKIRGQSIVAILDAYEGYNADNPEFGHYNRHQVMTERGRYVWVYTFNPAVFPEQLIESGDWCKNRVTSGSGRRLMEQ
jgi:gamma-glutamylcyclotransferase (GGCT)/AIG2-like uncharacterized protein YtfP